MPHRTAADALRERVHEICATGDDDLACAAWHALSKVLTQFVSSRKSTKRNSIVQRITPMEIAAFVDELAAARARR